MTDRGKAIKALECNLNFAEVAGKFDCEQCGYECRKTMFLSVPIDLLANALALLKAQEPVEPVPTADDDWTCGNCGEGVVGYTELDACGFVPYKFTYCPRCGREVKWE